MAGVTTDECPLSEGTVAGGTETVVVGGSDEGGGPDNEGVKCGVKFGSMEFKGRSLLYV